MRRAEHDLQSRLAELERRTAEMQRGLEAERAARERSERTLESMRDGHRRMEGLLGDMRGLVKRLVGGAAALAPSARRRPRLARRSPLARAGGAELAAPLSPAPVAASRSSAPLSPAPVAASHSAPPARAGRAADAQPATAGDDDDGVRAGRAWR